MSFSTKRILATLTVLTIMTVSSTQAATPGNTVPGKSFVAKEIEGKVYIQADDLIQQFGGTGIYQEKEGRFIYIEENDVPAVIDQVSPSVVAIIGRPESASTGSQTYNRNNLAHGTGVIVKSDGWILTNAHVVKGMAEITVVTADGKSYSGKRMNMDEESDLALVKISEKNLPAATFSSKETRVGETVIAIGTPISFALRNSVSVGVVSGVQRSINSTYMLLQTDAAINPGNSGGPLVNKQGEIVGINTLKFAAVGVESLGFSIPADTVQYVMGHFFKYGKVKRPTLGIELEESWAAIIGIPTKEPLKIKLVTKGSAGDKAGLKAGDVIYSVDNITVNTLVGFNELLKDYLPGDKAELMMMSKGDLIRKKVVFGE
jgi:serine protease Do